MITDSPWHRRRDAGAVTFELQGTALATTQIGSCLDAVAMNLFLLTAVLLLVAGLAEAGTCAHSGACGQWSFMQAFCRSRQRPGHQCIRF